jgi:hypothetical protein
MDTERGLVCRRDGLDPMSHRTLMMETEVAPETSVIFNQLTRLREREDSVTSVAVKASDLAFSIILLIRAGIAQCV